MAEDSDVKAPGELSRRRFINSVTGVAGSVMAAAAVSASAGEKPLSGEADLSAQGDSQQLDVIVIGGGFAGVTAARDLQCAGYNTLVLEARDRLGGRTFTQDFEGDAIEMGGTWVHNAQPFVWSEMQRYGIGVIETPGAVAQDFRWVDAKGALKALTGAQFESVALAWQTFCAQARAVLPRPFDLMHNRAAVLQAEQMGALEHLQKLELDELQADFIRAMVALFGDCAAEDVAYLEILRFHMLAGDYFPTLMDSTARFQIEGGTRRLIDAMVTEGGFPIALQTRVTAVRETADGVEVDTHSGQSYKAKAAVCTLPLNTLNSVAFSPPKPEGMTEMAGIGHPGNGHKLFVKVRGDVGNLAGFSAHEQMHYLMTYKQHSDYTLLVVFAKRNGELDVEDNSALQAALRKYIPDVEVLSSMRHDWLADPLAVGTWATFRPGWLATYGDALVRDRGALQFASGDIGEGWRGSIDGAIGAGTLAARRTAVRLG